MKKVVLAVWLFACFVSVTRADSLANLSVARPDAVSGAPMVVHPFVNVKAIQATGTKIFVSDAADNVVDIYNTSGKQLGQITGFSEPQGLAADAKGNLYVADTANSRIQVYAPPYTKSPKTLSDPGQYPVDVSVLNNGEFVAVANIISTSGGPGNVILYKNGKAVKTISNSSFARVYFNGFDAKGNLYVDGENSAGATAVGEIAKLTTSGKTIRTLTYNGTIGFPGGVVVTSATKIAIADQEAAAIYTYDPPKNGSLGNPIHTTPLTGSGDAAAFAFTQDDKDLWTSDAANVALAEFAYPAGGGPVETFPVTGEPIGIALVPPQVP